MKHMRDPYQVFESVYHVGGPGISGSGDCCIYLLDGGSELALIDTGCGRNFNDVCFNIVRLGFDPADIATILLTHCHIDHVGGATHFRREFGSMLVAHEKDCAPLETGDRLQTVAFLYGIEFAPLTIDRKLALEVDTIPVGGLTLTVLSTPGHSPGSVSAYLDIDGDRILFGQDIKGPFHPDLRADISEWRCTMSKLLQLQADVLCEGHSGVWRPACSVQWYIDGNLEHFAPRPC